MNIVIPVALVAVVGLLASCMLSYAKTSSSSTCAQSSPEQTAAAAALQDVTTTRTRWQRAVRLPARSALSAVPL